jgi:hypothetical protein
MVVNAGSDDHVATSCTWSGRLTITWSPVSVDSWSVHRSHGPTQDVLVRELATKQDTLEWIQGGGGREKDR